mmetsp:Transcript_7129/g.12948  ORF Transcript_7129/g.12948 Transcript_7129/m.12948 type:complete len:87 (+) Transcript_7129:232-492(+)|eukprot:CAMPEP_0177783062 /NCGR_PEP_ID=MMETSP0491_2-20121128/18868_1 /TAXON_ID=63592 /ORGANISM="Tetraselmis chuii, Strain PLY429" /LENGTH=86 /DNA_ID=CAMNT_0019303539 /DNA_START=228 /DNA_END=488 /DNA_ORIENTATION=-
MCRSHEEDDEAYNIEELALTGHSSGDYISNKNMITKEPSMRSTLARIAWCWYSGELSSSSRTNMEFMNEGCARNAADPKKLLMRLA